MVFSVHINGIGNLDFINQFDKRMDRNMARAVNKAARDGRALAARLIRNEVNFPFRFTGQANGRLAIVRQATAAQPTAVIRAKSRVVSLARFTKGKPRPGNSVQIEVAPGKARFARRLFLIKLPAGKASIDTKYNLGLAIRLQKGETLKNKRSVRNVMRNLYLLYGPSVDQIFLREDGGIAIEIAPEIQYNMRKEFFRLMELDL